MGFAVRTKQAASAYHACCTSLPARAQLQERATRQLWRRRLGSRRQDANILSPSTRSPLWTPSRELMRALYWTLRSTTTGPLVSLPVEACSVNAGLCALGLLLPAAVSMTIGACCAAVVWLALQGDLIWQKTLNGSGSIPGSKGQPP